MATVTRSMKSTTLPLPELGLIVGTRGMLAAGVALLLADRIPRDRRRMIALPLVAVGLLSTFPLLADVFRRTKR